MEIENIIIILLMFDGFDGSFFLLSSRLALFHGCAPNWSFQYNQWQNRDNNKRRRIQFNRIILCLTFRFIRCVVAFNKLLNY